MSTAPRRPKQHLQALGLSPKYHFGQNFLSDEALAQRIARLAITRPGVTVVEIGAGLGALTAPLLDEGARVVAIERDRDLVPALAQRFAEEIAAGRLRLREADAKTVDFFEGIDAASEVVVAGNLPYQLTGPLVQKLCGVAERVSRVVILVQLEVAERLVAPPAGPAYGALSVFVQAQYQASREWVVRRGAFYPQPNVDSAVVRLVPRRPPGALETPMFTALVQAAFQQRRKQLKNAWRGVGGRSQERIEQAANASGIDLSLRGECLGVAQFWSMAEELERL